MYSRISFFAYACVFIFVHRLTKLDVIFLLIFLIFDLMKSYFLKSNLIITLISSIQIIYLLVLTNIFSIDYFIVLPIAIFDMAFSKDYAIYLRFLPYVLVAIFIPTQHILSFFALSLIYSVSSYFERSYNHSKIFSNIQLDNERRLRYQLEKLRLDLLNSQKEVERLSVLKERDRIARELHDNLGHDLSALNIHLNALCKLVEKDENLFGSKQRIYEMADFSRKQLAASLDMLRKTVYDIKAEKFDNIEEIKKVIDSFDFCPIELHMNIEWEDIKSYYIENICAILKEALTNVLRHSDANLVKIDLDVKQNYLRLYIKDNGKTNKSFKEGMGISNMRLRVKNMGGFINIDNSDGFMIVIFIPFKDEVE